MGDTRISELPIAASISGSEYLIIDDGILTERTSIATLFSSFDTDNWDSVYTTVQNTSAYWGYQGTDIKALTGNWESTHTTVQSNSANWDYTEYLNLSGGIVTGDLDITGDILVNTTTATEVEANRQVAVGGLYLIAPPSEWGTTEETLPTSGTVAPETWGQYLCDDDSTFTTLLAPVGVAGATLRFRVRNTSSTGEVVIASGGIDDLSVVEGGQDRVFLLTSNGTTWEITANYPTTAPARIEGDLTLTGSNVTLSTPLPLASGGTGADSAAVARTNLGLGTEDDVRFSTLGPLGGVGGYNAILNSHTGFDYTLRFMGASGGIWDMRCAVGGFLKSPRLGYIQLVANNYTRCELRADDGGVLRVGYEGNNEDGSVSLANLTASGDIEANALTLSTPLPLSSGGTGADTAAAARTNLGLGTAQVPTFAGLDGPYSTFDFSAANQFWGTKGGFLAIQAGNTTAFRFGVGGINVSPLPLSASSYFEGNEMTAPAAPAANKYRIYAEDDGSGKTRLMVKFATGAAQQIAIEP